MVQCPAREPVAKEGEQLQIVSDSYRKKTYIYVPTAWINSRERIELLQKCQKILPQWKVSELKDTSKWVYLQCHPAMVISICQKDANPHKEWVCILMIYPRDYRKILDDPYVQRPFPVEYLGNLRHRAFYGRLAKKKKRKDTPLAKLVAELKLEKSEY